MRPGLRNGPRMMGRPGAASFSAPTAATGSTAGISTLFLTCRGVNRSDLSPSANSDLAYSVLQCVTNSPYFTDKSFLGTDITPDDSNTFHFSLTVALKKPLPL